MLSINTLIIIFIAFILQSTIVSHIAIGGIKPDIILLISIYMGLFGGKYYGAVTGSFIGIIQDSLSSGLYGINTFSKGMLGFITGSMREKTQYENLITQAFIILLATLFDRISFLFISKIILSFDIASTPFMLIALYQSFYNILIGEAILSFMYYKKGLFNL